MRKSIESIFFAFVFLTVLLSGCTTASTPIPPTLTLVPTNTPIPTKTPIPPTTVPTDTPPPTQTQVPWNILKSIATEENPIEQQNISDYWQELTLTRNLKFSGALEMKLSMESIGSNGIVLTYTKNEGEPYWQGMKRMQIFCEEGTLGIALWDGTSEKPVFTNDSRRPFMPSSNFTTICKNITVKFDQYAKNIQFFQDNKIIFLLNPEEVGDFRGGLFPDGNILMVDLSSSPKSGSPNSGIKLSSIKLIELVFYVPSE